MRIMTSGVMREVYALKHFKIAEDEYILYKNNENVSIGLIQDNKIVAPDASKLDVLMKVLSNLISITPNADFNTQNNCIELDKNIVTTLEEAGYQNVNIPEEQLNNLMSSNPVVATSNIIESIPIDNTPQAPAAPVNPANPAEQKPEVPKDNRMKIYGIIIVVLALILGVLLFKDKLFGGSGGSSSPTPSPAPTETPVSTTTSVASCPGCVFEYYEDFKKFSGDERVALTVYKGLYSEVVDDNNAQKNLFLGHTLDSEDKISNAYACGIENNVPFCLQGSIDGSLYESNKTVLDGVFGEGACSDIGTGYSCNGTVQASVYTDGNVKVIYDNQECQVYSTGDMGCQSRNG